MNHDKLKKAFGEYKTQCGIIEQKLQKRISFGEVSVSHYPSDGLCAMVPLSDESPFVINLSETVVPLDAIPETGEITEQWWAEHGV